MKQIIIILMLVALSSFLAFGQTKGKKSERIDKVELELLKLEREWIEAFFAKPNRALLERVMTDDYISNNADGTVTNKAQSIAAAESGLFVGTSHTSEDVKVRVYGNTAIITSLDTVKGKFNGQFRHTSIWVKRKGQWQVIGWQGTPVPQRQAVMKQLPSNQGGVEIKIRHFTTG
jgi:hypothetical protein